jgi:hypothetical protein
MKDIFQGPSRPTWNDLGPDFLRNHVARAQKAPIPARLRLSPLEILDLIPVVLMIKVVMVQGLDRSIRMDVQEESRMRSLRMPLVFGQI